VLPPLDNAFFASAGTFQSDDLSAGIMAFGQGTVVDYAYDGDVVFHELGHAVKFGATPLSHVPVRDAYAVDPSPAGCTRAPPITSRRRSPATPRSASTPGRR
jgi:hypothetical protein